MNITEKINLLMELKNKQVRFLEMLQTVTHPKQGKIPLKLKQKELLETFKDG